MSERIVSDAESSSILNLLPQSGPMRLVSKVLSLSESSASCLVVAGGTGLAGFSAERIPAAIGVEYMAQAVAVLAASRSGVGSKVGFIAALREVEIKVESFASGAELTVSASAVGMTQAGGVFLCELRSGSELLAQGRYTVVTPAPGPM